MLTVYAIHGPLVTVVPFPELGPADAIDVLQQLLTSPWDYELHTIAREDLPPEIRLELDQNETGAWVAFDAMNSPVAGALSVFGASGTVEPTVWDERRPPHPRHRPSVPWAALFRAFGHDRDGIVQDGTPWGRHPVFGQPPEDDATD